jgi:hypothetical protein
MRGCGQKDAQQFLPSSEQRLSSLAALGRQFVHHNFFASDFGPIQKLKYVFKGRKIRGIVTISRM